MASLPAVESAGLRARVATYRPSWLSAAHQAGPVACGIAILAGCQSAVLQIARAPAESTPPMSAPSPLGNSASMGWSAASMATRSPVRRLCTATPLSPAEKANRPSAEKSKARWPGARLSARRGSSAATSRSVVTASRSGSPSRCSRRTASIASSTRRSTFRGSSGVGTRACAARSPARVTCRRWIAVRRSISAQIVRASRTTTTPAVPPIQLLRVRRRRRRSRSSMSARLASSRLASSVYHAP